jgi:hypothetical protein
MAYGTAPHRIAPGVWATQDGRRLTPAGSAYWEHHHQQGMVTADGHTTQKAKTTAFGKAIDPTRSVLPAPPPPRAARGQPTITRGQWGGMTPKQKMNTQVTVTLSAHDRARLDKLRGQAPKGKTWAAPIPKVVNVPIGFGGASGIDQHWAAIKRAEAEYAKAHPPEPTQLERARALTTGAQTQFPKEYKKFHTWQAAQGPSLASSLLKSAGKMWYGQTPMGRIQNFIEHPGVESLLGTTPLQTGWAIEGAEAGKRTGEALAAGHRPGTMDALTLAGLLPFGPFRAARVLGEGVGALKAGEGVAAAAKAAGKVAEAGVEGTRAAPKLNIPERVSQIENWKRQGIPEAHIKAAVKFYDTKALHHPEGVAAYWRDKVGLPTGEAAQQFDPKRAENVLYQQHPDEEGLGHLYPEGLKMPSLGRMPRIKGMTPQLWNLIKRGAAFRDWYERGSGVLARFAERQGISNRQAAAIVAITSQQANPTFNLRRAAEMLKEWKASGGKVGEPGSGYIDPSTRFAGQAQKVTHVLENPETFNWDGVKTNNYFANFIHHLDPEFHAQLYGADTQVTVDRHIANMILGKKSVTPAQADEVGDLFVRTAKSLGWSPKEVQAAAWVPWKAEQMDITQEVMALGREMKKGGEIPKELVGKGKKIEEARAAFIRSVYESGRRPEGFVPKGWEHYKHTAADAYERGERLYSGEHGGTLYQRAKTPAGDLPKGAAEFLKGGKSRLHFFEGADVSTLMHELLHISLPDLKGRHFLTLADEFAGGKKLADWTEAEHEAVASAFEQWLRTGEITNPKLRGAFTSIKEWMQQLIGKAKEQGMPVPKDVEDAFNYMFREGEGLEKQVVTAARRAPQVYDIQAVKRSIELGERRAAMASADAEAGGGLAGQQAKLEALKGEYHKEPFNDLTHLTEDDVDYLAHAVSETKLNDLEQLKLVEGIKAAQKGEVFQPHLTKLVLKAFAPGTPGAGRTAKETAIWLINEIVNIPRSIMASGDLSGVFRQALVAFAMHPVLVSKEIKPMLHYFWSEKAYLKNQAWLATDPKARVMEAHGTEFTDVHHGFENREEQFTSSFAETITGGKHGLVRRSGRAYTGLLNNVRYALNDHMYEIAVKQNVDLSTQELKDISRVANWATGRGHLGGYETQKMLLNTFLFSPRLLKSRFDLLNPFFYRSLSPIAKRQAQRGAASLVLGGIAVLGMAKLSGIDVVTDPFSSDFGKMKIGNHRFDVWGGHQQVVRTIAQEMFGKKTKVTTGETLGISRGLPTLNFIRGKLAPPIGLFVDKATGSTIVGDPLTWKGVLWNHLAPLGWQDAYESYQDKGGNENSIPWGLGALGAATIGFGTQTIPDKTTGGGGDVWNPAPGDDVWNDKGSGDVWNDSGSSDDVWNTG